MTNVITYHLEMLSPQELRPKISSRADLALVRITPPIPQLNRFFYTTVGAEWYWIDRLPWTDDDWQAYANNPGLQTWMFSVAGIPAGYFELESQAGDNVEIVYFGLLPQFVGLGLGGHLLTRAVECAWGMNARRVWVHTCTLDHPQALANYYARGFRLFKEETKDESLPNEPRTK